MDSSRGTTISNETQVNCNTSNETPPTDWRKLRYHTTITKYIHDTAKPWCQFQNGFIERDHATSEGVEETNMVHMLDVAEEEDAIKCTNQDAFVVIEQRKAQAEKTHKGEVVEEAIVEAIS